MQRLIDLVYRDWYLIIMFSFFSKTNLYFMLFALLLVSPLFPRAIRGVHVDRFDPEDDWTQLSLKQKRLLSPYILESILQSRDKNRAESFVSKTSLESDQVLRTYSGIARVYFNTGDARKRIQLFSGLKKNQTSITRYLLDYFIGIESNNSTKRSSICRIPDHHILCQWEKFEKSILIFNRSNNLQYKQVESLLFAGREFLRSGGSYVPFTSIRLQRFCDYLYKAGFPLEAAIIAERFTFKNNHSQARRLRARIPIYLAGAGDFRSAIRFSFNVHKKDDPVVNNARLEWMILSGQYTRAINYLKDITPEKLGSGKLGTRRDPFSGFLYSRDGLRLRSAMLLYLNNDTKTAAVALKRLTEIKGYIDGVPARYYARLRLAQILLEDNPKLAHKIAEDIVYLAQEKGWDVLEYNATVLDAWALYYSRKYYPALINLIKARGILTAKNRRFYLHYSHNLALFAVRQKMKPRGNYTALINKISKKLASEPENEALLVIRKWAPRSAGPDFFRSLAVRHWNKRRLQSKSIEFLAAHRKYNRSFFVSGHNPGGVRGYINSSSWIKKLEGFSTMFLLAPDLRLSRNSFLFSLSMLEKQGGSKLNVQRLPRNQSYLFSFSFKKGWRLFLVYPSKGKVSITKRRGRKIHRTRLKNSITNVQISNYQMRKLRKSCPDNRISCESSLLSQFKRILRNKKVKQLNILYNAKLNLNVSGLILGTRRDVLPVYFNKTNVIKRPYKTILNKIYRPGGCENSFRLQGNRSYHLISSFFFSNRKTRSIYVWPFGLDNNHNKTGNKRAVYLRNFNCGNSKIRLWDMDRFSSKKGVGLVLYKARQNDENLDDAFVEYFTDRQTALLEYPDIDRSKILGQWLRNISNKKNIIILDEYRNLWTKDKRLRLILPSLYIR